MRKSTALLCLSLVLFVGSAEISWGAEFQKELGGGNRGDFLIAFREWERLAEQGDVDAQYYLGLMYHKGRGVPKNYKTAMRFWQKIADEQGVAYAQLSLGWLYQQGLGVRRNKNIAVKLWTRAAEGGLNNALLYKGLLYVLLPGEMKNKIFSRLFRSFSVPGGIGIYDNAAYWYWVAAEQGHSGAQTGLGRLYHHGRGVLRHYKTAVKWFRLAAEQGDTAAQYDLGFMYYDGQGVKQNNVYAYMWWNIAALRGLEASNEAAKYRDIVAKRMTPADISTAQKLARECVRKKYLGC